MARPPKLQLCPFCGGIPGAGPLSALTHGVRCGTCGATIELRIPDRYPKGISTLEALQAWTLVRAIRMWNHRVRT